MIGDGPTQFNVAAGGGDPLDRLLAQVREAAAGVYDILGEMGRSRSGNVVYLAREVESGHLVALKLQRSGGTGGGEEYGLEVVRTLDASLPGIESKCPECKTVLTDWERFCYRCGADLSGGSVAPNDAQEAQALLEAVREATEGEYEILGQMDRSEGGGAVFFAKEAGSAKLVALRLRKEEGADPSQVAYSIGETQVMRPLAAELGRTQVLGAATPDLPPPPAPPPVAPPRKAPARAGAGQPFKIPRKALIGGGAGLAVLVIAVLAFSGGDDTVPPDPSPAGPDSGTAFVGPVDSSAMTIDTAQMIAPPTPPPGPPPDSGAIQLALDLPSGAVFKVDNNTVRSGSIRLPAGAYSLSLAVPGYQTMRERVRLRGDQVYRWRPSLKQVIAAAPPSPRPAPAPPPPVAPTCARAVARSDWPQASDLCLTEATAGNPLSQVSYGRMRELGNGVVRDLPQAANWYLKAAVAGNREAQTRIGYFYRAGTGVKKNEEESARWFKAAADQGDQVAMVEYGVALENGDGVQKDEAAAVELYRKAASEGTSGAALRRLGRMYERGRGVQKNEAEAARYYLQASERRDAEAMYLLGRMHKDGRGVEKSNAMALDWFKRAAALGHKEAAEEAGKIERG